MMGNIVILLILFSIQGCSFFKSPSVGEPQNISLVDQGQIVRSDLLKRGNYLLIEPFIPGPGVMATDEVDRCSLMMVKGVATRIESQENTLKILSADTAGLADIILKGSITTYQSPEGIKDWVLRRDELAVGVKGKLIEQKTGKVILIFEHHKTARRGELDLYQLSLKLGEDLGSFIISGF